MSILKHLEKYFETTSPEQIRKDWEETSKFDKIGLSVDDFLVIQDRMNDAETSNEKCTLHDVSNCGFYRREDLNPEFLKIVDDIEDKIRR